MMSPFEQYIQELRNIRATGSAAILWLEPVLNQNYEAVKQATYPWST